MTSLFLLISFGREIGITFEDDTVTSNSIEVEVI